MIYKEKISAVSAAIFWKDYILLIQRAYAPYAGYWTFPGGKVRPTEKNIQAIKREIKEEISLSLSCFHPLTIEKIETPKKDYHLNIFYTQILSDSEPKLELQSEILEYRWVDYKKATLPAPLTPHLKSYIDLASIEINSLD